MPPQAHAGGHAHIRPEYARYFEKTTVGILLDVSASYMLPRHLSRLATGGSNWTDQMFILPQPDFQIGTKTEKLQPAHGPLFFLWPEILHSSKTLRCWRRGDISPLLQQRSSTEMKIW